MEKERAYSSIAIFFIAFLIFIGMYFFSVQSDHQTHVDWLSFVVRGYRSPRPNFLYQLMVYCVSFFNKEFLPLFFSSAVVLSFAVAAKFSLSQKYILEIVNDVVSQPDLKSERNTQAIVIIASLMLVFMFSLPITVLLGGDFYLTNFPPNIWKNPTTILLMPFALGLFGVSYQQLRNPNTSNIQIIAILCILNVLAKPSFFFVFGIVYPLYFLKLHGMKKLFWINMIPVFLGAIVMLGEYYLLYIFAGLADAGGGVAISLFTLWDHYSPSIVLSFIGSIFFPLLYFILKPKQFLESDLFKYASISLLVGVIIFSVFIETGERKYDGNFAWQYFVANYILYMVMTAFLVKEFASKLATHVSFGIMIIQSNWKLRSITIIFSIQFMLGVYYLINLFVN